MISKREDIFRYFESFMKFHGFEAHEQQGQYRKSFKGGFECVSLIIHGENGQSSIEPEIGVTLPVVDSVATKYLTHKKDSLTLSVSMSRLQGESRRIYELSGENALEKAREEICDFLDPVGFSMMQNWRNLASLNDFFNHEPSNMNYFSDPATKAVRGLIIAKLTNASHYTEIRNQYLRILKSRKSMAADLEKFKKLIQFLEYYSSN